MSDLLTTFLIIMSEAAAFFAIVIIVALVFRIRSGITLKRSAKQFVKQIKSKSQQHSKNLKKILLDDYNMDASIAEQAVEDFIKLENLLYSKIIELHLGDKNANLQDLDEHVKNLTNVMHSVTIVNSNIETEPVENEDLTNKMNELKKQVVQLEGEKKHIQEQLQDAMDTMEGMMTEYASMYAGGVSVDKMSPDDDIARVKDKISEIKQKNNLNDISKKSSKSDDDLNMDVPDLDIDDPKND